MQNRSGNVTSLDVNYSNLSQGELFINRSLLELGNDIDIVVTCTVNNTIASDSSTTIIQLCSKSLHTIF